MAHSTDLEDARGAKMGGALTDLFDGTVCFWIALWLGLTALALTIDQPIYDFVRHRQHRAFMYVCDFMEFMGGYSVHVLVLLIVAACRNWKRILVGYLTPMAGLVFFSTLVKYAVGRARPFSHLGAFHFEPLRHAGAQMNSFPSGNTVSAMALAALLGIYFPRCR
jgi:membrane-associated phospholipid phosphatase